MVDGDLAAVLAEQAAKHAVPGAAIGILHDGSVETAYYGVADIRTGAPVTAQTRFHVGSLTKPMVATVVAGLAAALRLDLDDAVAGHVPVLRRTAWGQRATLRDLLANRSGLPLRAATEFGFEDRADAGADTLAELMSDLAATLPADHLTDGAAWSYSNLGWCVLGRAIETVTGVAWPDAMADGLASLGLVQTDYEGGATDVPRASGHDVLPRGPVPVPPIRSQAYGPAGTTTLSTVEDLLRLAARHLEEPHLEPLRRIHASVPIHGWLDAWCLGWARFDWKPVAAWGWDGLLPGERSFLRLVPDRRAAVVLLTNGSTGRAMYRTLLPDLMQTRLAVRMPHLDLSPTPGVAGDLVRFTGVYAWPDRRIEVAANGDELVLTDEQGPTRARPVSQRVFLLDASDPDNPTVTFGPDDEQGRPRALYSMLWGLPRQGS